MPECTSGKEPLWQSQRFWLTLAAIIGVVVMSITGVVDDLSASDLIMIMSALVLGKSLEQGLAKRSGRGQ
jgi:hypothetical protein